MRDYKLEQLNNYIYRARKPHADHVGEASHRQVECGVTYAREIYARESWREFCDKVFAQESKVSWSDREQPEHQQIDARAKVQASATIIDFKEIYDRRRLAVG